MVINYFKGYAFQIILIYTVELLPIQILSHASTRQNILTFYLGQTDLYFSSIQILYISLNSEFLQ